MRDDIKSGKEGHFGNKPLFIYLFTVLTVGLVVGQERGGKRKQPSKEVERQKERPHPGSPPPELFWNYFGTKVPVREKLKTGTELIEGSA